MVPTFTCGLSRSNFSLAISYRFAFRSGGSVWVKCLTFLSDAWQRFFPCLRANLRNIARFDRWWLSAPESALRSGPCRVARAGRDDLFSDVRGNFLVLLELHRVRRAALRRGSQIGRVAEHFAERDEGLDGQRVAALVLTLHLAAPPRKIADHVAEEVLRGHDLDRHHRLEKHGVGFAGRLLDRHRTGDFEGHLRGVDVVVGAVDEFGFDVDQRVAGLDAVLERLAHPLFGRADVFAGDGPAADFVLEDEALAGSRLEVDDDVAELAATTGLTDESGDDFLDPLAHRLAGGDLRFADVRLDFELAQHPVDDHLEVELAHPVDQGLARFLVGFDPEGRVLLAQALEGVAHLLLVGFRFRLDRDRDHRLREFDRLERDRRVGGGQRVTGGGFFEADAGADVARVGLLDLLARVRVHHQQAADALGAPGFDVEHATAGLQFAGVDAEVGQFADVGVGHDLEGERRERAAVVGRTAALGRLGLAFGGRDLAGHRGNLERRGEQLDDRVEQRLHALVLEGRARQDRRDLGREGRLAESLFQLRDRDLLFTEERLHDVFVEIGGGFDQLGA